MIDKQKELDSRERFEKWFVDGPGNRHVWTFIKPWLHAVTA